MSTCTDHEILILGAHFAAISTAHYLLRHVIPALSNLTPSITYHVTIVSPHTEFFWNIAAPRYIANKELILPSKIFQPIADAFKGYQSDQYDFILGKAVGLDPENRTVDIRLETGRIQEIKYSSLVIATGSTYNSGLWQINNSQEITKAEFSSFHTLLPNAKTVLVAGGGAVGVETAGEIASYHSQAETIILSGAKRLLPRLLPSNSAAAEARLERLGVQTVHNLRVLSTSKNADGTTAAVLSDGSSRSVDVFIDATGGKPNSTFLPPAWLDAKGHVATDNKSMRVTAPGADGVYAVGDVASYSDGSVIAVNNSVAPVATSIAIDIAMKAGKRLPFMQKEYKPMEGTQLVPTGPKGGVGQLFGWKIPSAMVWLIKSRTFFVEKAEGAVKGLDYLKP
ncbi:MAG: hypothetical protein M1830_001288 [Pleopsidium flavum]|nr:MAG: hypothetical protein M1830_001288 [Pleopsidium flavum]